MFGTTRASATDRERQWFAPPRRADFGIVAAAVAAAVLGASAQGIAAPGDPREGRGAVKPSASHGRKTSLDVLDKPSDRFQRSLKVASRKLSRARAETSSGTAAAPGTYPGPDAVGVGAAALEQIALCESGGDPTAVSADGAYRGKYQFDYGTWASVGGSGDPAAAPESEQDYRAALLYAEGGAGHWPNCA